MRIDKEKLTLAEHLRRANKKRWKKKGAKKAMALSMRNYWAKFSFEERSRILGLRAKLRESRRRAKLALEPESAPEFRNKLRKLKPDLTRQHP